jgi:hypothetical protein
MGVPSAALARPKANAPPKTIVLVIIRVFPCVEARPERTPRRNPS